LKKACFPIRSSLEEKSAAAFYQRSCKKQKISIIIIILQNQVPISEERRAFPESSSNWLSIS